MACSMACSMDGSMGCSMDCSMGCSMDCSTDTVIVIDVKTSGLTMNLLCLSYFISFMVCCEVGIMDAILYSECYTAYSWVIQVVLHL